MTESELFLDRGLEPPNMIGIFWRKKSAVKSEVDLDLRTKRVQCKMGKVDV